MKYIPAENGYFSIYIVIESGDEFISDSHYDKVTANALQLDRNALKSTYLFTKFFSNMKKILSHVIISKELLSDMETLNVIGGNDYAPHATKDKCTKNGCINNGCNDCADGNTDNYCIDIGCIREEVKKIAPQCGNG